MIVVGTRGAGDVPDIGTLVAEIAQEPPCGPNLEYMPEFLAVEQAAMGKPERQIGTKITPAEPADWAGVAKEAQALLARSKDIRVAVLLTRALTRTENIIGLSCGLTMIYTLLERYWEYVHPQLDPEDGDATARLNALAAICEGGTPSDTGGTVPPRGLLRDAWDMLLVSSGPSKVTVRDILAVNSLPSSGKAAGKQRLEGMMVAAAKSGYELPVSASRSALEAGDRLFKLMVERVGSARSPNIQPLLDVLKAIVQLCDDAVPRTVLVEVPPGGIRGLKEAAEMENAQASNGEIKGGGVHSGLIADGEIRSRDDAVRMLDRVCEFMERTEPSHPAPLLIRRAQRLLTKNFVEIIQELAPESMKAIQQLAGLEQKTEQKK